MMWHWYPGHMGFGAGGWIGMGFMMLFWVAVVIGIIYLVRYLARRPADGRYRGGWTYPSGWEPRGPTQAGSSALQILEERYARGEIDRDEFLKRKADIPHFA